MKKHHPPHSSFLTNEETFYEVLEISPSSNQQEIREAYLRLKGTYSNNNLAIYPLLSTEETTDILAQVELAYHTLSNPDKRRVYDQGHLNKFSDKNTNILPFPVMNLEKPAPKESYSPERNSFFDEIDDELLVAPRTDIQSYQGLEERMSEPTEVLSHDNPDHDRRKEKIEFILNEEKEWRGAALKEIRELRDVSLEELSEVIKVTRRYLAAIEEEDFSILPAPVFVRGFVFNLARHLGLPADAVAMAYIKRYRLSLEE
jgi:curved DNA-binding protein CbpA